MKRIIKRRFATGAEAVSDLHPLLQRIYPARGIKSLSELERGLERLLPYQTLSGVEEGARLLAEVIAKQELILIVGDFDADGATSTAVAIRALRMFGAKNLNFLVPNRFAFGYGLTPELVEVAAAEFHPALIVTVDNGIANHAGVDAAKAHGIKVIITDHHLAADTLPNADVIINPNQPGDNFPSKCIAGVGVIFYVMLALRRHLLSQNWFATQGLAEPNMASLLDIVALGTIADVVSLDQNNRILVHQGLRRIRAGHCIPGINALLNIAGKNPNKISATDLGFSVAPRLNAAGRLDDMALGIECLLTDDPTKAQQMAAQLDQLNTERRVIEQEMQGQALQALSALSLTSELPSGICLFDETWHQGVIGILASRIKERTHRPVIVFALANEAELKGSARSMPGLHIRDVMANIASQYPQLITKFGGHAMAAGLTLPRAAFADFSAAFAAEVQRALGDSEVDHSIWSDGELLAHELTLEVAEILRVAGPWGQSFPEPVFDGKFQLLEQRLVGGKHLKMLLSGGGIQPVEAIAFNIDAKQWPNYRCQYVNVAYRMDINEYRGKRSVQLIVEHLELA